MNEKQLLASLARSNAGRDPDRLRIKYSRMAADKSAFFRCTAGLFYELLPRDPLLQHAPLAWITADLHLENFGSYLGDNALAYFDLNDFDEAALAPATYECVRTLAHLAIVAPTLGIAARSLRAESRLALDEFVRALARGKSHWVERRLAVGAVKKLLRQAADRKQRELLDQRTYLHRRKRQLLLDSKRALPLLPGTRTAVERRVKQAINALGDRVKVSGDFEILDVARRIAGAGSLGLERYVVLLRGNGKPNGARLLDLKFANPSCLAVQFRQFQPQWKSEATRIVSLQRRLQAESPALLCASIESDKSFVLKELQPAQDRLQLADLSTDPARRHTALATMMRLSAWSMLRASGWDGAAPGQLLTAFAAEPQWQQRMLTVSAQMAEVMTNAWEAFRRTNAERKLLA